MRSDDILTGKFRLCFPNLAAPDENGKYRCTALFDKDKDAKQIKRITKALEEFKELVIATELKGKRVKLKMPFKDGDERENLDKYPEYENKMYMEPWSNNPPQLVDEGVQPVKSPIAQKKLFYPGCYCDACISFFFYERDGSRGILANLEIIQFVEDGKPLGKAQVVAKEVMSPVTKKRKYDIDETEDDGDDDGAENVKKHKDIKKAKKADAVVKGKKAYEDDDEYDDEDDDDYVPAKKPAKKADVKKRKYDIDDDDELDDDEDDDDYVPAKKKKR